MSLSGGRGSHSSGDRSLPPNGRKRKLSSQTSSSSRGNSSSNCSTSNASTSRHNPISESNSKQKQSVLKYSPSRKRSRRSSNSNFHPDQPGPSGVRNHCHTSREDLTDSDLDLDAARCEHLNGDMAHQPVNNKVSYGTNNFRIHKAAGGAGLNNHAKKPGQGKKLVIKNRKGTQFTCCLILLLYYVII